MPKPTRDLVQIIKDNPGCVAVIDNDCWTLYRKEYATRNVTQQEADELEIADSSDILKPCLGDGGYGSGETYGGDILQALAKIVGVKVESV